MEQDSTIECKRPPVVIHFPNDMNVVPTKPPQTVSEREGSPFKLAHNELMIESREVRGVNPNHLWVHTINDYTPVLIVVDTHLSYLGLKDDIGYMGNDKACQ